MGALSRTVWVALGGLMGCAGAHPRSDASGVVVAAPPALSSAPQATATLLTLAGSASGGVPSSLGAGGLASGSTSSAEGGSGGASPDTRAVARRSNPAHFERPRVPAEVTRENEQFRADFPELEPIRRLPDFLSVDAVIALLPDASAGDTIREGLHRQFDGAEERSVLGGYLDEEERLFCLWIDTHVLTDVFAVFESGRLAAKVVTSRARASLRDLLSETDGARAELVLERVTSPSVCCLPLSLEIYRINKRGKVTQIFDHPRGHVDVGPGERWSFLNHFEFDAERLSVSSVLPSGRPTYDFVFEQRAGRYLPTASTQQRLREERQRRAARKPREGKAGSADWSEIDSDFH